MSNKKIHDFIKKRKYLIWWTDNWDGLNDESIVEATLNYGDWDDVQELIKILGMNRVAEIFRQQTSPDRMRCNYHPKTKNYFTLYFNKYDTQRNIERKSTKTVASRSEILSKL